MADLVNKFSQPKIADDSGSELSAIFVFIDNSRSKVRCLLILIYINKYFILNRKYILKIFKSRGILEEERADRSSFCQLFFAAAVRQIVRLL